MNDHTKDRHAHQAQVYQLMPRGNDLHRHFPAPCYRPRKVTPRRIAKRAAVVAVVLLAVFAYFRFQLWGIYKP